MTRSLLLAAAALTFSSAIALAENGPQTPASSNHGVRASAQSQQVVRPDRAVSAKTLYDYAPVSSYTTMPLLLGVAY
jgi:hypothetical protein